MCDIFFRGDGQTELTTLTTAKNARTCFFNRWTICPPLAFQPFSAMTQLKMVCTHIFENPEFGANQRDDGHRHSVSPADPLCRCPRCPPSLGHCPIFFVVFPLPPPLPPAGGGGKRPVINVVDVNTPSSEGAGHGILAALMWQVVSSFTNAVWGGGGVAVNLGAPGGK
jgi:hypothetical protein